MQLYSGIANIVNISHLKKEKFMGTFAGYLGGPNADTGFYWSSSAADTSYVYRLRFNSVHVAPASKDVRNYGYSVRLVADCQ